MFEEFITMHAQGCRELIEGFERDIAFASFDAADVGAVDVASRPEFFLGPSAHFAQASDRRRHDEIGILLSHPNRVTY